jgi:hypothetical protein
MFVLVPGKSVGVVRVIRSGSSDENRIYLRGFHGVVKDISFALHEKRILVAAVDEYSYLLIHEIIGSTAQLILQVNPDGITTATAFHRVVWCNYMPSKTTTFVATTMGRVLVFLLCSLLKNLFLIWFSL